MTNLPALITLYVDRVLPRASRNDWSLSLGVAADLHRWWVPLPIGSGARTYLAWALAE